MVAVVAGAFLVGSLSAPTRRAAAPRAAPPPAPEAPSPRRELPRWPPPSEAPAPVPAAAAPAPAAPPRVAVTPELAARVADEARERLAGLRPLLARRCWPEGGLRSGRAEARIVVNLTFDASGREIARGISENRRAPAGEVAACLRRLRDAPISVAPPGANVGVSVPLTLP